MFLDTQAALWWLIDDARLTEPAAAAIAGAAEVAVSVASVWELEIKRAKGKFDGPSLYELCVAAGFRLVEISADHARAAAHLPAIHADPFDRMIVAQAITARRSLVTADSVLSSYAVSTIW